MIMKNKIIVPLALASNPLALAAPAVSSKCILPKPKKRPVLNVKVSPGRSSARDVVVLLFGNTRPLMLNLQKTSCAVTLPMFVIFNVKPKP